MEHLLLCNDYDIATPDGRFLIRLAMALANWEEDTLNAVMERGSKKGKKGPAAPVRLNRRRRKRIAEARCRLEAEFYSTLTGLAHDFRVHEMELNKILGKSGINRFLF